MANSFGTNPIYLDTDTAVAAGNTGTNWKGTGNSPKGSSFTGGLGIRPIKIIIAPATSGVATVASQIVVNQVISSGTATDIVLLQFNVPAAMTQPIEIDLQEVGSASWKDFVVTGLTTAKIAMQIYYRV